MGKEKVHSSSVIAAEGLTSKDRSKCFSINATNIDFAEPLISNLTLTCYHHKALIYFKRILAPILIFFGSHETGYNCNMRYSIL